MEAKMVYKQRDVLKNQVDTQKAEIERLEEENRGFSICLDSAVKTALKIKSEAIKEFWNELKSRNTLDYRIVSTITGDNLVKELTEENKGQAVSV
ncbi:MAG: hypothetical protein IKV53_07290 [Clostridia bacterium]|nr:hypothetical protein [Clostridia bacterium]